MGFDKDEFVVWATNNVTGAQANILLYLLDKERTKTMVARELGMPRQTLEASFKFLIESDLVKQTKQVGRQIFYTSTLPAELTGGV